jgi:gluconolactonase
MNISASARIIAAAVMMSTAAVFFAPYEADGADEPWKARNTIAANAHNLELAGRSDIVETGVTPSIAPGSVVSGNELPDVDLAPGVKGKMFWGKGALVNRLTMEPGAETPREKLPCERIMVVWKGSVEQLVDGRFVSMRRYDEKTDWSSTPHSDFIYLPKGAVSAMKAGPEGAVLLEVFQPVHPGYIRKAGGTALSRPIPGSYDFPLSFPPGKALNYYDIQFTDLSQGTLNSRIISGSGVMCSFSSADPERVSPFHAHPEEQLTIVLRGRVNETVIDSTIAMKSMDILYLPGNMVHRGQYDKAGCDMLDIFWPPRPDFIVKMNDRLAKFHALIPKESKVELVHDGAVKEPRLNFTEGPVWLGGRLYMANMWFAPDFSAGSPEKSNIIRMERDGSLRVLVTGLQTNGMITLGNGNLAVCDMYGHRVVEMEPEGRILRTIADSYNGVPFDGPNDLVVDAKGGIYITDPQFTPGLKKTQPGKSVFYIRPDGGVVRVVNPGEMGNPNGILLSPDGSTLYICNTRNLPAGNHIMAFDVKEDGALSNGREFAKMFVPPEVLEKGDVTSGADGMRMDVEGNLYVATHMGLQIFDKGGAFVGIVYMPVRPTSLAFGAGDMKTIYFACPTKIYKIRTNIAGLRYPARK